MRESILYFIRFFSLKREKSRKFSFPWKEVNGVDLRSLEVISFQLLPFLEDTQYVEISFFGRDGLKSNFWEEVLKRHILSWLVGVSKVDENG